MKLSWLYSSVITVCCLIWPVLSALRTENFPENFFPTSYSPHSIVFDDVVDLCDDKALRFEVATETTWTFSYSPHEHETAETFEIINIVKSISLINSIDLFQLDINFTPCDG